MREVATGRWERSIGSRSGQATEVQRGVVTYAISHSLTGSLELANALASEGPRVLPKALEHLGRTEPGEEGWDMASQLHFDGMS